ncbi:MAG TPA: DUF2332 domain-containing protein [Solirubrobacterales bacterium]|nr:DUF2332 domain-containing protein [Solirubrobacterales bacterium]
MATETTEQVLAESLRIQARACEQLGSELYAVLMMRAAEDVEAHGPTWDVLRGHEADPPASVPALRLMGAVNRLVLVGREPTLAQIYEGPTVDPSAAWEALSAILSSNREELRELIKLPVQTNEVGRCAALLFGFLAVAGETRLPLRLLEVGASAGLNLHWDRYRYEADGFAWGPADSRVRVEFELDGEAPTLPAEVEIAERRGCDAAPIDPSGPEGRQTMLAYIWPDQKFRLERMRAALRLVEEVPIALDRETAVPWTERMLAEPTPGTATVVYHSIVMQYLGEEELAAFHRQIETASERATADAPLAWLRMEPAGDHADLHLTVWPGGEKRRLARAGYHGTPVELLPTAWHR